MGANTTFGVQVLFQNDQLYASAGGDRIAAMKAHIDAAASLGVGIIRFPGDWRAWEPDAQGHYSPHYLAEVTETIAYAKSLGIDVVMTFAQTPYWATAGTDDPDSQAAIWAPPTGTAAEAYAAALVKLYTGIRDAGLSDAVTAWEVWNEPNTTTFWPTADLRAGTDVQVDLASAAEYVALLNTAYDALKAIAPEAVILGGSLAACDLDYVEAMYALGAKFDALAVHPYTKANPFDGGQAYAPDETAPGDPLSGVWSFQHGVEALRALMIANGDADKAMWFTEFGWSSTSAWGGAGSEAIQAQFLTEALAIIEQWDFVDVAIAYRLFDGQGEEFGMMEADGTLKPSGIALQQFLAGLPTDDQTDLDPDGLSINEADGTASYAAAANGVDVELSRISLYLEALGLVADGALTNLMGSGYADTLAGDSAGNVIDGGRGNDTLDGRDGNDTLRGGAGDNWIFGGDGDDVIIGGADCDWIEGGAGADTISGGGYHGHVLYWSSTAGVAIDLQAGTAAGGDAAGDRLTGIEAVDGSAHADQLAGDAADNWLIGLAGEDRLSGRAGHDRIDGGLGRDVLTGGTGADLLIGGAGMDIFDFNAVGESRLAAGTTDRIADFERGLDHIDLSTIDANTRLGGNQSFKWIGGQPFHKRPGELHTKATASGLVVEGDVNGDGRADFRIAVDNLKALAAGDFVL